MEREVSTVGRTQLLVFMWYEPFKAKIAPKHPPPKAQPQPPKASGSCGMGGTVALSGFVALKIPDFLGCFSDKENHFGKLKVEVLYSSMKRCGWETAARQDIIDRYR